MNDFLCIIGSGRDGFNERDLRSLSGNSNFGSATARNNNIGGSGPKAYDTVVVDNVSRKSRIGYFYNLIN